MESVAGIVFDATRTQVLLIRRRDIPVWVLPGGGIEKNETPEEAACREVCEETGLEVKIVRKIALYEPRNKLAKRTHFFECGMIGGALTTTSESRCVRFFPLDNLPVLPPPYPFWIQDALPLTREILSKEVEGVSYWILFKLMIRHPVIVVRFLLTRMGIHINSKD